MQKLIAVLTLGAALSLVLVALAPAAPRAEVYTFKAPMNSRSEVPKPKGAAGAKGNFSGTLKGSTLKWTLTFSGLSGAATAAHIHMGKAGVAGPVLVPLCGPCKTGATGTAKLTASQEKAMESGGAYVNVHTAKNAGGEIRGQITSKG